MNNGGDVGALYRQGPKTVFHASLANRAGAGVLDATAEVARALGAQLGRVSKEPGHQIEGDAAGCVERWGPYCHSIATAVQFAREQGAQVLVGTQPYLKLEIHIHDVNVAQQTELREMLTRRFASDASVAYVNLGDRIDLEDVQMSFDHMHLTEAGNREAAAAFVEHVLTLAARRTQKHS